MLTVRGVRRYSLVVALSGALITSARADVFGSGANTFSINFVPISGATNPAVGIPAGPEFTFTGVMNDYRMGTLEVTNSQWNKFKAAIGVAVTGSPLSAYDDAPAFSASTAPTTNASWLEAAQFVNWLNTSTGHHAAYNFTGTQGTSGYTFAPWAPAEAEGGTNLYRHKDAMYYLPTQNEWVKAAFWNGTSVQTYATKPGDTLHQGNGSNGHGWNYYDNGYATFPEGPWAPGSGSQELNGTYDMMGNVWEWLESPYNDPNYGVGSLRADHGGSYYNLSNTLELGGNGYRVPDTEFFNMGFRIASDVPEPCTMTLLALGGMLFVRKRG